jgi:hypothetical protein
MKNKKLIGGVLAGAIALGSIGGGVYAYQDEWTAKIYKGVDLLAGFIYKDDIEKEINSHNEGLKSQLRQDIQGFIAQVTSELQEHKQNEIDRGKKSLDQKYNGDKNKAQHDVNSALRQEKQEQKAKTDAKVETEKGELDAIVEAELSKIPN